jgi:hypothetical protein
MSGATVLVARSGGIAFLAKRAPNLTGRRA